MAQNLGSIFAQNLATGLGEGLASLTQHKLKEIEHNKMSDLFKRSGYDEPTSKLLSHIYQASPKDFYHTLSQLGGADQGQQVPQQMGSIQQGQSSPQPQAPQQQGISLQQALAAGKKSAAQSAAESKEDRKQLHDFLKTSEKAYAVAEDLGNSAEDTLKYLEKHKSELPGFLTRNFPQKYNPLATPAVRKLEAKYGEIAGKTAALNAMGTGFRSGKALLDLAQLSKAAVNQPYETQVELLQDLISKRDEARDLRRKRLDIKAKSGGSYPLDLADRLAEMDAASNDQSVGPLGPIARQKSTGKFQKWNPKTRKYDIEVPA